MNTKEKIEVMQAFLDGKQVQIYINREGDWRDWHLDEPHWDWFDFKYRIKPEPRIIDLSVCIKSGIDMEFCDSAFSGVIGGLKKIDNDLPLRYSPRTPGSSWSKCRVRENYWHAWLGGDCPLPEGLEIEIMFRDRDTVQTNNYIHYSWDFSNGSEVIIAFKVLGTADGWKYEWEECS